MGYSLGLLLIARAGGVAAEWGDDGRMKRERSAAEPPRGAANGRERRKPPGEGAPTGFDAMPERLVGNCDKGLRPRSPRA